MDAKERYMVALYDGSTINVIARNFTEILDEYGEDNVWMMIKLNYDEEAE